MAHVTIEFATSINGEITNHTVSDLPYDEDYGMEPLDYFTSDEGIAVLMEEINAIEGQEFEHVDSVDSDYVNAWEEWAAYEDYKNEVWEERRRGF